MASFEKLQEPDWEKFEAALQDSRFVMQWDIIKALLWLRALVEEHEHKTRVPDF